MGFFRFVGVNSAAKAASSAEDNVLFNAAGSQLRGADGKFVNTIPSDLPDPTNLECGELRQMSDGRWKFYSEGEPRTAKGNYNYIVQDGKIYVGLGNSFQGHIDIARGHAVNYAGQISFGSGKNTKGILNEWNNGSGHYKPEPAKPDWSSSFKLPFEQFKVFPHD